MTAIILVNPQIGENIGASARAMLNFGLTDLRIVTPRDGWPNQRAIDMASGAFDHMSHPKVFETLKEAIADLEYLYATTARSRELVKPVLTPRAAAAEARARDQKIGFVFGAERTGLTNDELALCHSIINIPTNPDFSSLNLGQAVLLIASELFQAADNTLDKQLEYGDSPPAPQSEFDNFFQRLESELEDGKFFQSADLKPTMLRNIRSLFLRAEPSTQEINTLHGIISALIGKKTKSRP